MSIRSLAALLSLVLALCACAEITPMVDSAEKVDPSSAYLYGNFMSHLEGAGGIALQLERVPAGGGPLIRFRNDNRLTLVKVPPGTYVINRFHHLSFGNQIMTTTNLLDEPFNVQFKVEAGRAYYLGDQWYGFQRVDKTMSGGGASSLTMDFSMPVDKYAAATQALVREYPTLRAVPTARAFKQP